MLDMLKAPTLLDLDDIAINGGTQPRAALNQDTIAEYAEALKDGANFPPVIVYYDGKDHWLADGFHRYHAHRRAELTEIHAEIRQGTRRDAVLYSVSANSDHGLRRTNEDKRRAVMMLLADEEWNQWSDREIARRAKVSNRFVSNLRSETVTVNGTQSERTYTTKHGTQATMNTANIGAKPTASVDDLTRHSEVEDLKSFVPGDPKRYPPGDLLPVGHATEYRPARIAAMDDLDKPSYGDDFAQWINDGWKLRRPSGRWQAIHHGQMLATEVVSSSEILLNLMRLSKWSDDNYSIDEEAPTKHDRQNILGWAWNISRQLDEVHKALTAVSGDTLTHAPLNSPLLAHVRQSIENVLDAKDIIAKAIKTGSLPT